MAKSWVKRPRLDVPFPVRSGKSYFFKTRRLGRLGLLASPKVKPEDLASPKVKPEDLASPKVMRSTPRLFTKDERMMSFMTVMRRRTTPKRRCDLPTS